jgi:hypothetical protein
MGFDPDSDSDPDPDYSASGGIFGTEGREEAEIAEGTPAGARGPPSELGSGISTAGEPGVIRCFIAHEGTLPLWYGGIAQRAAFTPGPRSPPPLPPPPQSLNFLPGSIVLRRLCVELLPFTLSELRADAALFFDYGPDFL